MLRTAGAEHGGHPLRGVGAEHGEGVGFIIAFSGLELAIAFIQAQVLQY